MKMTLEQAREQAETNAYIEDMIETYINPEMRNLVYHSRLRTCSAWVYETEHFYILKSYNTFIASYNKETHEFIDFLRYVYGFTPSSCQHIAKFRNDFARNAKYHLRYYEIPSKWEKKINDELVEKLVMPYYEISKEK